MKNKRGHSGTDLVQLCKTKIAINEKGGMDDDEFEIYITNSTVPLFSDAKDIPGKRVIIKIDTDLFEKIPNCFQR